MFKKITLATMLLSLSTIVTAENRALSQRIIPKLNQKVTFLGLGTVELGRDWGIDFKKGVHPTEADAEILLKESLATGINVVDTATSYQLSEERIGKYIPQSKHAYLLITKPGEHSILASDARCKTPSYDNIYCRKPGAAYDFSAKTIFKEVEESLKKLNVKTLDVVLLHLDNKEAQAVLEKGEALGALHQLKKAGKIRAAGVSTNGSVALYAVKNLDIDVLEVEYNLLNQTNKKAIDIARKKEIGVVIKGGLGTGLLTPTVANYISDPKLPFKKSLKALLKLVDNDYEKLTALSLYFLYKNPGISTVVVGVDNADYLKQNIQLLDNFENTDLLDKAQRVLSKFPVPTQFTEIMGEFYSDQKSKVHPKSSV